MDLQNALEIGSRISFACAAVLALVAGRYAVVHDVRGVANDLSGRQRLQDIERSRAQSGQATHRRHGWDLVDEPATEVAEDLGAQLAQPYEAYEEARPTMRVADELVTEMLATDEREAGELATQTGTIPADVGPEAAHPEGAGPEDVRETELFTVEREVMLFGLAREGNEEVARDGR